MNGLSKLLTVVFVAGIIAGLPGPTRAQVDPHCTNGGCDNFSLWCLADGRVPMCLNQGSENEVSTCVGHKAASAIYEALASACLGSCADPWLCNWTGLPASEVIGEPPQD